MAIDESDIEKSLCDDAAKIVIDEKFKYDLKNRILFGSKYNNITELPKHINKYFKIASCFVICIFVGGTIFKAVDVPTKKNFTKAEGTPDASMSMVSDKGLTVVSSEKTYPSQILDDIIKNNYKNKQTNLTIKSEKSISDKALVYDSRYFFDEKKLVSVKNDGTYVKDLNSSIERYGIIYLYDKYGQNSTEIVDDKKRMISKNVKKQQ